MGARVPFAELAAILSRDSVYRIVSVSLTGVPAAGQRHAPVLVERAGGDLDPRRSGAADSLGFVDAAHHFGDHGRVKTGVKAP